eukprot:TRINITY_DN12294_c0_g1_i1.p1 TRINITY_DN12294_c0_g1~~TRINITY_DN12294_c0_g1_i1.p1  ORF type:complete len:302 (-),score=66.40 TRINITY_DN12294_c0_g1_i1:52-957(-)
MKFFIMILAIFCISFALSKSIPTPMGRIPEECVHEVESGSEIQERNGFTYVKSPDGTLRLLNSCIYNVHKLIAEHKKANYKKFNRTNSPLEYDGWLAYTSYERSNKATFDTFLGYFSVPNNPSNDPEVLYIFTGLQNNDWVPLVDPEPSVFDIIQPVLQYPASSGSGWSVKSWYVTLNSGVIVSREILVNAGDNIYGNMTRLSSSDWYIGGTSTQTGKTSEIKVSRQRLLSQPWSFNTIECYGCGGGCSYLPTNTCVFSKLSLTSQGSSVSPSWNAFVSPNPICNTKGSIQSPSQVTFSFQ